LRIAIIDTDHFGAWRAGARQLRCHVLLIQLLDGIPVEVELFGYILDRRLAAAPTHKVGEPLGEVEPLPFHFATKPAKNASHFQFEKYARVAAREVAYVTHRAIVPAVVGRTATSTQRFFERRFSLMMRVLGSPKMPRTVPSGRKSGNAYASRNRRFRFAGAAIRNPAPFRAPPNARNPAMMRLSVALTPQIHPHYSRKTHNFFALDEIARQRRIRWRDRSVGHADMLCCETEQSVLDVVA
jgi:hypothetical protein